MVEFKDLVKILVALHIIQIVVKFTAFTLISDSEFEETIYIVLKLQSGVSLIIGLILGFICGRERTEVGNTEYLPQCLINLMIYT